jgi:ribosomal protein L37AE/L43A
MINQIKKRCPKCKSVEIYKRTRIKDVEHKIRRPRFKSEIKIELRKIPTKIYICRACDYEFDSPFIGKKY